jgi:hypothetical protein
MGRRGGEGGGAGIWGFKFKKKTFSSPFGLAIKNKMLLFD